jgi:transposase
MENLFYLNLKTQQFKRRFGVQIQTFKQMLKSLKEYRLANPKDKRGAKNKLTLEQQILVALEYWREYRTYFHVGTNWGISESTTWRIVHYVESTLMKTGKFGIPGKKALLKGFGHPEVVVMDVTETSVERPKKKQKKYYSGKKKCHTLKMQVVINQETKEIICLNFGPGHCHDFNL